MLNFISRHRRFQPLYWKDIGLTARIDVECARFVRIRVVPRIYLRLYPSLGSDSKFFLFKKKGGS